MTPDPADVPGIHHVTAIAGDPHENVRFYTDVLGLRFVKRTVNFDDTSTYHLYYGDEVGTPGTIMTFFPFEGGRPGRAGRGQAAATAFSIPEGSAGYWVERLEERGVDVNATEERFGDAVVPFRDGDGQPLELIEDDATDVEPWTGGDVPAEHAVRGFHGVTLHSADHESTGAVLETLGYQRVEEKGDRARYRSPGTRANAVDVLERSGGSRGRMGAGTVHHVAFRTADRESQEAWRERLTNAGLAVTGVKDRQYFTSIYFREPGGVLFEVATDGPGFTVDESSEALGGSLKLPPWLEEDRELLAENLPELDAPTMETTEAGE